MELGAAEDSLVQLRGGINNRVYSCGAPAFRHVIKGYAPASCSQRDRMRAEVEFLAYARQVAPQYVPRLVHADHALRCVVLEFLVGDSYTDGVTPPHKDIEAAVDFFRLLNADRTKARREVRHGAAEGFLKVSSHIANVRERIAAMRIDHLPRAAQTEASELLSLLQATTARVTSLTEAMIANGMFADAISSDETCLSPSDFGYHNAIRTPVGVKFIDFEFAGWDDPAKAAADFVLQPRVPSGCSASALIDAMEDDSNSFCVHRFEALGRVLRLKWVCIMLAVLRPERLAGLMAMHPNIEPNVLCQQRLTKAAAYLQQETPFDLH
jgi:hypothetical protein